MQFVCVCQTCKNGRKYLYLMPDLQKELFFPPLVLWPLSSTCWPWPLSSLGKSDHETANLGSFMVTFDRVWKLAMKLPRLAVWKPKLPMCWKLAMKLPRFAVWDPSAEKGPWNCQCWVNSLSTQKSVVQTARVGSSMATFLNFQIWQVYPSVKELGDSKMLIPI